MGAGIDNSGKRRRLAPFEKYEIYVAVLTGKVTGREAADKCGLNRTTVTQICWTAKKGALRALAVQPGRPQKSPEQVATEELRAQVIRLRATVAEQAVALRLYEGKVRWDSAPDRSLRECVQTRRPTSLI